MIADIKKKQPHIVEFGCATGLLLSLINKKGYTNITGVDPSPACGATAKKYYGINVLTNTLSDVDIEDNTVDFLILVGVLEHIKDLDESLQILWAMLAPKGRICIIVPDGSQYFNGKDAPFQEFSVEHINFFGPVSLENLMKRNGFSKVDISQAPIEAQYNTVTPVIMSIFEKQEKPGSKISFTPDPESKKNLIAYIEKCKKQDADLNAIIEKIIQKGESLLVWGTGAQTLRLLVNSKLGDAKIAAFVDSNPKYQGKTIHGTPVIAPQDIKSRSETILISTRAYQNEIEHQIKDVLGLPNDVVKLY